MAGRLSSAVVYAAGAVQGIVLVTFPAASTIFTTDYGLSNTQYGMLFVPQVVLAILASLLGSGLGRKAAYLAGLGSSLVAMVLLLLSTGFERNAFPVLLCATAFVGLGFGLTVPALNSLTAAFHPDRVDRSVLVLNALLGVGTVLAPFFVADDQLWAGRDARRRHGGSRRRHRLLPIGVRHSGLRCRTAP